MTEGEKQKQLLDREIRDMISALTHRLADLQRGGGGHEQGDDNDEDDDERGVRIITLAGSNVGATLRSHDQLDAESWKSSPADIGNHQGDGWQEEEPLTAFVNSNFQAINNSLMLGGSYTTNDPGVHMDVSDAANNNSTEKHDAAHRKQAGRREGKKKAKATTSKSDNHSQPDDA